MPSSPKGIQPRFYRNLMGQGRFKSFVVGYKDSDLWLGVDAESYSPLMPEFARECLVELRKSLEAYIVRYPEFATSFCPVRCQPDAPPVAKSMCNAAHKANTGPMAAVAGAFSEFIAKAIDSEFGVHEIVAENGGDLFLKIESDLVLSVYAGASALSGKVGLKIPAALSPLGVCTSAGTVGPSASFGQADAVVVAAADTATADAFATAIGNRVQTSEDIEQALKIFDSNLPMKSLLIICDDKMGVKGEIELSLLR
ncbi:MAG: UPF0280 family protein [Prolixibacteraceae bacterium]|nr:UPF0280 family protein [Prolixibacteraceae bacterium]MBN2648722.1 UPF0280 family protein [Prolixibacteraceae bacterium]